MPYQIITGPMQHVEDVLNGTYVLPAMPATGLPVGALTLIFAQPAAQTVTFSGLAGAYRTPEEIRNEINTALSVTAASLRPADPSNQVLVPTYIEGKGNVFIGKKVVVLQDDTSGVQITGGTARALMGIPTSGTVTFVPIVSTKIVSLVPNQANGTYTALISP